jgi:hypothetical protein
MWIYTKYGFYGVVCARKTDNSNSLPDPSRLTIRTRNKQHLLNLQEKFPELQEYKIHEDGNADYLYRIFIPAEIFPSIMARLSEEIDYDRFKPAVEHFDGSDKYKSMLLDVWHATYKYQD